MVFYNYIFGSWLSSGQEVDASKQEAAQKLQDWFKRLRLRTALMKWREQCVEKQNKKRMQRFLVECIHRQRESEVNYKCDLRYWLQYRSELYEKLGKVERKIEELM